MPRNNFTANQNRIEERFVVKLRQVCYERKRTVTCYTHCLPLLKQNPNYVLHTLPLRQLKLPAPLEHGHGLGKTHLAIGLAMAACRQGYRVRFFAVPELVNELRAAYQENRLNRFIRQWLKYDLVVQDELGYVPFDQLGAQLLFQVLAARYERGSIIITTNLEFGQWVELFGDERLTAALIDRLTHRAYILVLNGESYRFRESLRRQGAKDASSVTG
ncbi:IstB-like ATP binding protein [Desulfofundulus australicus DSM 11792]|uniref:IstB-like ATP binding protein n=1 Tax=Desulfofundulus australicus DSM 11792 TaxID=1121425 RepID=A0A1M4V4S0_9FIRM|nr:ATP-binding protein [Desulfofundulus australicus]SHE63878.1 IstB-like ATP binding protein [Desulfofundulus australicus DSM 11792]